MAKKILCVIRVSTTRQETESQHNDMLSFLNGRYSEDEIEWIEVAGASARKANKKYLDMLEDIKNRITTIPTIKACAFWHLNRLGRIESYINLMKEWFIKNQIQVYVKTPTLVLLNNDGSINAGANISWSVYAALVAYDTEEMMEKMQRGKDDKKAKGKFVGGRWKYGFKLSEDKVIIPNENEIKVVQLILNEYSTGQYSIVKLWKELKSRGYKVSEHNIASVISDSTYKSFVDDAVWDKCSAIREVNKTTSKESKNHSLVNGIVKCKYCGGPVISADTLYYACYQSKFKYRTLTPCNEGFSISKDVIDTILWDIAIILYQNSLLHQNTEDIKEYENNLSIIDQKINEANKIINELDERLDRAAETYTFGGITKDKYIQIVSRIKSDTETKRVEINALNQQKVNISKMINSLQKQDLKSQINAMLTSEGIIDNKDKKIIIDRFISICTIGKAVLNGKNVIEINVTDIYGTDYCFYYFKFAQKGTMIDKLVEKNVLTNKIIPYLSDNTEGYKNRAESIIQSLKDMVTK